MLDRNEMKRIRELCREHDEFMAQCRAEEAARVIRKVYEAPPPPEPPPPTAIRCRDVSDELIDGISEGALLISRHEADKVRRVLQAEINTLRSTIVELVTLVRNYAALREEEHRRGADIVTLPPANRKRA
jgi:hypothetical protein